jgi:mannitol-1-/sugar-/sorbitol-6-phosphatase
MRIQCAALLIDIDGTLVDSDAPIARAWALFAEKYGVPLADIQRNSHGRRAEDIAADFLPPEDRAAGVALVHDSELTDFVGLVPTPGAVDLIASLDGMRWALVTSGTVPLASARLGAVGLPRPQVMVTAENVPRGKPDPAGYRLAARQLGLDPADCIAIEDAPSGLAAARAAGCRTLAVTITHTADRLIADWVVPDLRSVAATADGPDIALQITDGVAHAC